MKSLEYIYEEKLIVTTAFDKKVKVWDSETGITIFSFQLTKIQGNFIDSL